MNQSIHSRQLLEDQRLKEDGVQQTCKVGKVWRKELASIREGSCASTTFMNLLRSNMSMAMFSEMSGR